MCVPNRLLNHATQPDQTLHKGVNNTVEGRVNNRSFFEGGLQNNSEKFHDKNNIL